MNKWHARFLKLAELIATWSKDPSTQVGAVIVDEDDKRIVGVGYNGLPRGVEDTELRLYDVSKKYPMVVHAELNAILNAGFVRGCTLYVHPLPPCNECAKAIIQAGIKKVVCLLSDNQKWEEKFKISAEMFSEAGVEVIRAANYV